MGKVFDYLLNLKCTLQEFSKRELQFIEFLKQVDHYIVEAKHNFETHIDFTKLEPTLCKFNLVE